MGLIKLATFIEHLLCMKQEAECFACITFFNLHADPLCNVYHTFSIFADGGK